MAQSDETTGLLSENETLNWHNDRGRKGEERVTAAQMTGQEKAT